MIQAFESAIDGVSAHLDDLLATAAFVTAASIRRALPAHGPCELIVSGGVTRNRAIIGFLRSELGPAVTFVNIEEHGITAESKEAVAFALLGAATLDGVPSNVPSATGAKRNVVLGTIAPI